jgi:hypothetical protein
MIIKTPRQPCKSFMTQDPSTTEEESSWNPLTGTLAKNEKSDDERTAHLSSVSRARRVVTGKHYFEEVNEVHDMVGEVFGWEEIQVQSEIERVRLSYFGIPIGVPLG